MQSGSDIYLTDDQKLREAKPDLIIAQGVCEVCAPFTRDRPVLLLYWVTTQISLYLILMI
jgi:hypothetical protein